MNKVFNAESGTILLVESRRLLRVALRQCIVSLFPGYVLRVADSVEKALTLGRELQPDIVLIDNYIPGMNFHTAIQKVKENMPDVPVVVLGDNVTDDYHKFLSALGISGYLALDDVNLRLRHLVSSLISKG